MTITPSRLLPIQSLQSLTQLSEREDPFLHGVRGLSIVMVIWIHTLYAINFAFDAPYFQSYLEQFWQPFRFLFGADKAVDIFFMLSAFLLGRSLHSRMRKKQLGIKRFYIERFFRIYPLFLVGLFLFGSFDGRFLEKLPSNLIFIDNIVHTTIIPVGWSLSVEMQCYLALPWVILLAHRSGHPIYFLTLLLVATIGWRFFIILDTPEIYQTPFIDFVMGKSNVLTYMNSVYHSTPGRVSSFVIGLLWAYMYNSKRVMKNIRIANTSAVLSSFSLFLSLLIIWLTMQFPHYIATESYYETFNTTANLFWVGLHRILFCIALLNIILMIQSGVQNPLLSAVHKFFSLRFWRPLSQLSFPIYLFHFPFIVLGWLITLRTTELELLGQISILQTITAGVITTILVAWFSLPVHFLLERKGIALGKRLAQTN